MRRVKNELWVMWLYWVMITVLIVFIQCKKVEIRNDVPRRDVNGNILDAHDGCLVKFGDTYYLYGTVYELCHQPAPTCNGICGYYPNTFALYTSPDLLSWKLISSNIVPEFSKDNTHIPYWMPNVSYNKRTQTYVMIFWSGHYGFINSNVPVATSKSPFGPFVVQAPITMRGGKIISSTINFFTDLDTGTGYVRYNTRDYPLRHVIEQLTDDWLSTTGQYSTFFIKNNYPWYEGGGMFKNYATGVYYVQMGSDCCFCQWGASGKVFYATNPLSNWTEQQADTNLCSDGKAPDWKLVTNGVINPCSPSNAYGMNFTVPAQQFNVAVLPDESGKGNNYIYYGERSRSAPDGLKAHNYQAWVPLSFDAQNQIRVMTFPPSFEITIP